MSTLSFSTRTPSLLALLLYPHSFSTRTHSLLALLYSHTFSTLTPLLALRLYSHSFSTRTPSLLACLSTRTPLYSHSSTRTPSTRTLPTRYFSTHSFSTLFFSTLFLCPSLSLSLSVSLCHSLSVCLSLSLLTVLSLSPMYLVFNFKYHEQYENLMKFDSHVQSSSVKFQVRHPMVKNCSNVLAGNIFIIELREQFSVCLNNEAHELGCICTSHFFLGKGKMPS